MNKQIGRQYFIDKKHKNYLKIKRISITVKKSNSHIFRNFKMVISCIHEVI